MNPTDHIINDFQNRARASFNDIYKDFQFQCSKMDRSRQEHDFKQLQERYVNRLQDQLRQIARQVLHDHRHELDQKAGYHLNNIISEYVHELVVHTRDL